MIRFSCLLIILMAPAGLFAQSDLLITQSGRNDTSDSLKHIIIIEEANSPVPDDDAEDNTVKGTAPGSQKDEAVRIKDQVPSPEGAPGIPAAEVEQTSLGNRPPAEMIVSFEGLGHGFRGPQGESRHRNPSDNSLAVGHNHIVQTVNSKMAIFTKKGEIFNETGRALYGPVNTNNVFRGFGGPCEEMNNGDAVVRYDQLADRWLLVMPIFRRLPPRDVEPEPRKHGEPARESMIGNPGQPGNPEPLFIPEPPTEKELAAADSMRRIRRPPAPEGGSYCMCYAVSTGPDPFGSWNRYEFVRPLFPDYPRPAVWPDGYYVPTSTGDHIIQKHACVVERDKMLRGEPAKEICFIIDSAGFLNNIDLDGFQLPPDGEPNIMMATGGTQLRNVFADDGIYFWKFSVNWDEPEKSRLEGPEKIEVAEYNYLGDGQLTKTVPQPGSDQRLDSQGDKIMSRLVYRRIGSQESIVAVHSVNTMAGGGGVRWYEFRIDHKRNVTLYQQGTFAPDSSYRWMASPAMDRYGNIGIGYSFGGKEHFPGQRFSGRLADDPPGVLTLRETILADGEASQHNTMRWMDYTQTAVDPSDDHTIWYVGDYLKEGAEDYSTRIGAFRIGGSK